MKPDRRNKVEKLFHAALEKETEQQAAFLAEVCAGDEALRAEVESLLRHGDQPGSFIESPSTERIARDRASHSESSSTPLPLIGKTVSHYHIVDEVGVGGEGVVYRARDTELGRDVAIKMLPEEFAHDANRIARFQREAKVLASLNHSNIAVIYDLKESDGMYFLVLELVEGVTLADLIKKGPIPVEESIQLALQIAEALEAAHEKSIIHRDLKPANIKVTPEGKVKVLDFGLAKHLIARTAGIHEAPTVTTQTVEPNLTGESFVVGTVSYMSPEQVEGKSLDARSDIFSMGAVLYELLTGQKAFKGDSAISTMSAILRDTPMQASKVRRDVPHRLDAILNRCFEKDRELRYASAAGLHMDLAECQAEIRGPLAVFRTLLQPRIALPASLILIVAIIGAAWFGVRNYRANWARNVALPEIARLSDDEDYFAAFRLAKKAEEYIRGNRGLADLWPKISHRIDIETVPEGAEIFYKEYSVPGKPWVHLGLSPLKGALVPLGYKRWLIRKSGYVDVECAGLRSRVVLDAIGTIPPEMVRVEGNKIGSQLTGLAPSDFIEIDSYLIDKYEVTNREYKRFVDAGGYRNRNYWKYEFVKDGHILDWEQGVAQFKDATGRAGPSTWESAMYPQGEDELPVQGVSWYEAAAYAEFVEKTLPSLYHWSLAAGFKNGPRILPLSNFSNKGSIPVGRSGALSHSGAYDMAGNVREWIWNSAGALRYLLGGAWSDPNYMFRFPNARSPFDRSAGNGFRCARYIKRGLKLDQALRPVPLMRVRDYTKIKRVDEDVYRTYESQFAYDRGELEAKEESVDDSSQYWKRLKISFSAAYEHERMTAIVFLPKNVQPPFQTLVFFPNIGAIIRKSSDMATLPTWVEPIIKSGRGLAWPVYKGTFERNDGLTVNLAWQNETVRYKDYLIKWVMDFRRTIDCLETRPDIDAARLGFLGASWGGANGGIIPAVEKRLKVNILINGGLISGVARPEVDQLSFVSHVRIPTLMINGRYDQIAPMETAQRLLYRMLGTPQEQKRYVVYDIGHVEPPKESTQEILAWLDRYLGPVKAIP